jgi:hypothetical protein
MSQNVENLNLGNYKSQESAYILFTQLICAINKRMHIVQINESPKHKTNTSLNP